MLDLVNQIKLDEGFNSLPYIDPIVKVDEKFKQKYNELLPLLNLTVGYGTKLPLTEDEAEILLRYRLRIKSRELSTKCKIFSSLPKEVRDILLNMSYNLGVEGLCKFKKMWYALSQKDYDRASIEMLDSKWATQVKSRAIQLSKEMKKFGTIQ